MAIYSIDSTTTESIAGPKLRQGKVRIFTTTTIYWSIGENPTADAKRSAVLKAGDTLELNLPVNCSRLAVLAVKESGTVTITELIGGARASCSY